MNLYSSLPLLILLSSLVPGLAIFLLREESRRLRTRLNLLGALAKLALVGVLIWGVFHEKAIELRWLMAPGLELVLHADALSVLFVTLSSILWLVTTIYAIGYLEGTPHRSRFFGFFSYLFRRLQLLRHRQKQFGISSCKQFLEDLYFNT